MVTRRRLLLILALLATVAGVLWFRADDLPNGFEREVRHLWSYRGQGGFAGFVRERIHQFSVSRPGRGSTPLQLSGGTISWSYSNPTSVWFAFGDLVGPSNLFYWELALPKAQTLTGALAELPQTVFRGLDSNHWAGVLGTGNVAFAGRTVGQGAIRIATNQILFARHVQRTDVVEVVQIRNFRDGAWGEMVAEFAIGTVPAKAKGGR